jgi:hypothetical protein
MMAKHTKSASQEAIVEALTGQVEKLAEEMRENNKRVITFQENSEGRLSRLEVLVERLVKHKSGKEPVMEACQSSTQPTNQTTTQNENDGSVNPNNGTRIENAVVRADKGIPGIHRTQSEETFRINEKEYN